jgi:hypothetical protein
MSLVACSACGAKISKRAASCPTCGHPNSVASATSERFKDLLLALYIVAVVIGSCWILVEVTIGRAEVVRLFDKAFDRHSDLTDETVTLPMDEFRGILVSVPYAGKVRLEIASAGAHSVDVHLIDGTDLLRLAGKKPPFADLKLSHHSGFQASAAPSATLSDSLRPGSYVVVLEHSKRGAPSSDVRVVARLTP